MTQQKPMLKFCNCNKPRHDIYYEKNYVNTNHGVFYKVEMHEFLKVFILDRHKSIEYDEAKHNVRQCTLGCRC